MRAAKRDGTRWIDGGKGALAQQKTISVKTREWVVVYWNRVGPHDVALRVYPQRGRRTGPRKIDNANGAFAQQKTMGVTAAIYVGPHDLTLRVDAIRDV